MGLLCNAITTVQSHQKKVNPCRIHAMKIGWAYGRGPSVGCRHRVALQQLLESMHVTVLVSLLQFSMPPEIAGANPWGGLCHRAVEISAANQLITSWERKHVFVQLSPKLGSKVHLLNTVVVNMLVNSQEVKGGECKM